MLEINELNHTSVLISSLDKIYNLSRLNGKIKAVDLYILNIIFKLLNGCCLELTNLQRKILMDLYRHFYFNTEYICPSSNIEAYIKPVTSQFTQADSIDCNNFEVFPKIYYWQENQINTSFDQLKIDVLETGYFNNISNDLYEIFANGKVIIYSNIGKIGFVATECSYTDVVRIYDILGNEVTESFDIYFKDQINSILILSKNNFSHGEITIKIIK